MVLKSVALSLQSPYLWRKISGAGCGCQPPIPSWMATYRTSFFANWASARILARVVGAFGVISAVFFLISGEDSRLPWTILFTTSPSPSISHNRWQPNLVTYHVNHHINIHTH